MVLSTFDIPVVRRGWRILSVGHLCGENRVNRLEKRVSECHDGVLVSAPGFQGAIAQLQP